MFDLGQFFYVSSYLIAAVIFTLPFIALHIYVALKSKTGRNELLEIISILLLFLYIVALSTSSWYFFMFATWVFWPPSY